MQPEQTRQERFTAYAAMLRERFQSGMLSELQSLSQWVVWRGEMEDGKRKKIPYNPHYRKARASVKVPDSWGTLEEALTAVESGNFSGIGFMITPPLVMIDLDKSYDRKVGTITDPKAQAIVHALNSYTEASPSNGLHILVYGQLPGKGIHTGIEIYGQDRFTTITTDHLPDTPLPIATRQAELEALYAQYAPMPADPFTPDVQNTVGGAVREGTSALPPEAAGDAFLLKLLQGDTSAYQGDQSRAEFVCLMKLMHYTGDNRSWTKAIFASYPIGRRAKVREDTREGRRGDTTYLDYTIDAVLKKRRNPPMRR